MLLVDPLDPGVGKSIEEYAKAHGVPVIDYDRLTLGGARTYYVSFDNVQVGHTIGQGFVACVKRVEGRQAERRRHARRADRQQRDAVRPGLQRSARAAFKSGTYIVVAQPAGTWDPPTALTEFQAAYTAHKNINAALMPNDENAAPIINYLKTQGIKANTFPTTGQDATADRPAEHHLRLPVRHRLQADLPRGPGGRRAGAVPAGRARPRRRPGQRHAPRTRPPRSPSRPCSSIPEWVTPTNMKSTVIADKFVPASQLCTGAYAADCTKYGITLRPS